MARRAGPASSPAAALPHVIAASKPAERWAVLGALAVLGSMAAWVALGTLQQDLAAFVTAARARALGLDPYVNHLPTAGGPWDGVAIYRHSRFLYPPLLAELFRPLAALPYAWGKTVFTLLSVGGLGLGLWLARGGMTEPNGAGPDGDLSSASAARVPRVVAPFGVVLFAAAVWPPVFVALERGQVDLLLLPLLALAWRGRRERPRLSGVALAVATLAKPFVLLVWLLLLCARRYQMVAWAGAALAAALALGAIVSGPALSRAYVAEVLPRAMLYGEGGPEAWLLPDESLRPVEDRLGEDRRRLDAGGRSFPIEIGAFRRNASLVRLLAGDDGSPAGPVATVVLGTLAALLGSTAARRPTAPGWFWAALLAGIAAAPVAWAMSLPLGLPLLFTAPSPAGSRRILTRAALAIAYGAGALGPFVPAAWCLAAVAGVAAGALSAEPRAVA